MPRTPERERERQAAKSRQRGLELANVVLPKCKRPELVEATRNDLHLFLQECFPNSTGLRPFGAGQVQAVKLIENAILHGGRVAQAFPRGFAKTSISARAAIWGILFNHRCYIPIFGASEENAKNLIDSIKMELEENDILLEMFPPLECIRALEGKSQRVHSQHIDGQQTHMRWTADRIVLPTVNGWEPSGNVLQAKAMRSARGLQYTTPEGHVVRPDFVILDDIQADEDARSQVTVQKIIEKVKKGILRGGGHSKTLAACMNCTVICPDDVAEYFLAATGWQSVRYKMVLEFPKRMDLWEGPYKEKLVAYDRNDPDGQRDALKNALEFYRENQAAMDEGAAVAWDWAYAWDDEDTTEISALQHAMNIKLLEGDEVFMPECQNEPIRLTEGLLLTPERVMEKRVQTHGVPQEATELVCHIDVQQNVLIYTVMGVGRDYTGGVVELSVFPDQPDHYYSIAKTSYCFDKYWPGETVEGQIYSALETLVGRLAVKTWKREDGQEMSIGLILVDSGFKRNVVELFCRSYPRKQFVFPARGMYVGAKNVSLDEKKWEPKPGEVRGNNWELRKTADGAGMQVLFDANYWKTFVWDRYALSIGAQTSWRVMQMNAKRAQMLADQLCSEYPTITEGRGRQLQEWQLLPGRRDNHYLDNAVGCAVAANIRGCMLPSADAELKGQRKRRRVSFKDRRR